MLISLQKIEKLSSILASQQSLTYRGDYKNMTQTEQQTKVQLRPLGNRVLVRRLEAEETLKGGIILPETAKKKQENAVVVAIGTGKKDKSGKVQEINVKIGDIILMDKYSGQEVTVNDEEYVIVRADDIIAVVEK